jgi:hypothetical protein
VWVFKQELAKRYKIIEDNIMGTTIDPRCHIGETHGVYTIVDMTGEKDKYGHWIYKCVCNECGFVKHSHYGAIAGKYKTVTCRHLRANGEYIAYGHIWGNKRLGSIFQGMIARCYDMDDKSYPYYGAKGIGVCQEWMQNPKLFEEWALCSGYNNDLTIDRLHSDRDYCPSNCQWISLEDNSRKAGVVNWITIGQDTLTGRQWADKVGVGINIINTAIRKYGVDKTKELITAMLQEPPSTKEHKSNQNWFSVYGIPV